MEGTHNFTNFCKSLGLVKYKTVDGVKYTPVPRTDEEKTRTIKNIEVIVQPPPLPASIYPFYTENNVIFMDVVIEGQSFLHNQVRRMVGAALSVGVGAVDISDVEEMINDPDKGWDVRISPAPARGLFLARVEYKPEALEYATDEVKLMNQLDKVPYNPNFHEDFAANNSVNSDANSDSDCDNSVDKLSAT